MTPNSLGVCHFPPNLSVCDYTAQEPAIAGGALCFVKVGCLGSERCCENC